eukprot:CAMPEP_0195284374 /NCGR_PEP_ID=MMETSP0707-20130614/2594_1 /TAXON_ID=33640 /ORGANISM="Asterionellopsis glacialis, Strain CCMP134" /LENGTH=445 /DNA_ID=CAMNT_0040343701 /DNA_START=347 /DNA_END=1682 /DNA_ORIENTATION=-
MTPVVSSASTMQVPRFHEIVHEITKNGRPKNNRRFETSYSLANVTSNQTTSWFKPQKICQRNCCAETVAISLHQDSRKIINTIDGFELADVAIQHYKVPSYVKYHGSILHEDILPCLQPGTIIQLENHVKVLKYFFRQIRPNITVPYLLITSKSDANSPLNRHGRRINQDDLMLNWYGTNPDISKPKFTPMPLGLPAAHLQEAILNAYLEMTNFMNPFSNKDRWLSRPVLSNTDIFVHFGNMYEYAKHRKAAWDVLCGDHANPTRGNRTDEISCVYRRWPTIEVYTAASKYLFAVSPPGAGYDCYRTYEWLLLGVIPIVMERPPSSSQQLFEDLPVVFMPRKDMYDTNLDRGLQKYISAIQNYTQSAAFLNNTFDKGWKRLFLKHWRRKILKDAGGRDQHIIQDENSNEFYQAWKYTPTHERKYYAAKRNIAMYAIGVDVDDGII